MMNIQNMMKQAQKMQKQLERKQAELAEISFTGKSAQDLVAVTLIDDKELVVIEYKEGVVDPEDIETLQDMITQAINDTLSQIDEATKETMGAFAGKLPF